MLRLLLGFSECGISNNTMTWEGIFPSLMGILNALHESDIALHEHPQVLMAYFEVCYRYANAIREENLIGKVAMSILGNSGLRNPNSQVRHRAAYFFLKFTENLEIKSTCLLNYVGGFSDLILSEVGGSEHVSNAMLNDNSELYLLESIGIITSNTNCSVAKEQQRLLFTEMISHLREQVRTLCSHPDRCQYEAEFAAMLAHKASSFAALAKGHSSKLQPEDVGALLETATEMGMAINLFAAYPNVRARGVIFMHRMIMAVGSEILLPIQAILPNLLTYADAKETDTVVQLLNQCMIEFTDQVLDIIDVIFLPVCEKYKFLYSTMEHNYLASQDHDESDRISKGLEGPRFDVERTSVMKQFLLFVQHIVRYDCHTAISISQRGNTPFIQPLLHIVLASIRGLISTEFCTQEYSSVSIISGIPLRKCGICILTDLVKEWSNGATGIGPQSILRGAVPPELSEAFARMLFDELLPSSLAICVHRPTSDDSVDLKDAQTLSLVQDIGVLLWTIANVRGVEEIISYLEHVATPSLCWPAQITARVIDELKRGDNLGTFKDMFKKIIKSQCK